MEIYLTEQQIKNIQAKLEKERKKVNTNPTESQIKAENYKMGHITINGFDITIENPKGSYRRGKDKNGKEWKTLMHYDYGYFKHTLGKDGDAIDVFIGPYLDSDKIFCVDQFFDGKFDETKVMLGFKNKESAKKGYLKNYEKDWKGFKEITEVSVDDFKKWLYDGHKQRKPFYQYVEVKNYYLTENQINIFKNKLNEFDLEENWWQKCIDKYQKDGYVKLYHNTTKDNLENILIDGELDATQKHTEGHGDMLFFTVNPDDWGKECKISIEVPIDEFGNDMKKFRFMNNSVVSYERNIPIDKYNFKIEKVGKLYYQEIITGLSNDDDYVWDTLANDSDGNRSYLAIINWFFK